jgi:uncharacterized protein (DUF2141 family)
MKFLCLIFISFLWTKAFAQYSIEVKIDDIRHPQGTLYIALCNDPKAFLEKHLIYSTLKIKSKDTQTIIFKDIAQGTYAIRVYHDINDSGKMETGTFGIPKEPFGFSNNPSKFSAPSFKKSQIAVNKNSQISISLQHY